MGLLDNEIALVTGASRGIGAAIALELARQGAFVVGTATSDVGAAGISQALGTDKLNGQGLVLNVNDPSSVERTLTQME